MDRDDIKKSEQDEKRREKILEAAFDCFLKFGFEKTSLKDVAEKADISRPLIYLHFKNKENLFLGILESLLHDCPGRVEELLAKKLSRKEKLMALTEIMLVESWDRLSGHPMSQDFYEKCSLHFSHAVEKHLKLHIKAAQAILGSKERGEVYFFATEGLHTDLPTTKVLRNRVAILVDAFC